MYVAKIDSVQCEKLKDKMYWANIDSVQCEKLLRTKCIGPK